MHHGAATARQLSKMGAKVAIFDKNKTAENRDRNHGLAVECDVTEQSVEAAVKLWQKNLDQRECINCAGIIHSRRMINQQYSMPVADFENHVNLIVVLIDANGQPYDPLDPLVNLKNAALLSTPHPLLH